MLMSTVATGIRFCNLKLYNGLVGLGLNKILQHKEMMFRSPRGLGSSQRSMRQTLAPGASESWSPPLKAQKRRTSFEEGPLRALRALIALIAYIVPLCNLRTGTVKYKQGKFTMVPKKFPLSPKHSHDLPKFPWSQKFPQSPTPYRIDYIAWQFP